MLTVIAFAFLIAATVIAVITRAWPLALIAAGLALLVADRALSYLT